MFGKKIMGYGLEEITKISDLRTLDSELIQRMKP